MNIAQIKDTELKRFAECRRVLWCDLYNTNPENKLLSSFSFQSLDSEPLPENDVIPKFWYKVNQGEITSLPEEIKVIADLVFQDVCILKKNI